jgi:hypothetical protein
MSHTDLGACCACGTFRNVRNVVMLPFRAPEPGKGWGCVLCHLPNDGAVAVLCDDCQHYGILPFRICLGYPGDNKRLPMPSKLNRKPFGHDMTLH